MIQNTKALSYRSIVLPLHFSISFTLHNNDKLISAIPIEWRMFIQSNTSTTFIQY